MEVTCTRCHQPLEENAIYCASCGLPQLLYQAETGSGTAQPERRQEPVRDAASVAWKPAVSAAVKLAIPAGMIFAFFSMYTIASNLFPMFLVFSMAATATWVVAIYMRNQKPAWITIGAGARIGLVTGILSAWSFAAICGLLLYGARYWFNDAKTIDDSWTSLVRDSMAAQSKQSGADPATIAQAVTLLLSPEGRAAMGLTGVFALAGSLLVFSTAGGALGARFLARPRRPEA